MAEVLRVGIAEMKVARGPVKLVAHGIGSCVVLTLWDAGSGLGGMVHSLLPTDQGQGDGAERPEKYCDSAAGALLEALVKAGARRERCAARIVGGATMFAMPGRDGAATIGERNVAAAHAGLRALKVVLTAEESGGEKGRSMELDCLVGSVRVWSAAKPPRCL